MSRLIFVLAPALLLSAEAYAAPAGQEAATRSVAERESAPQPPGFDPAGRLLAEGRAALIAGDLGRATASLGAALDLAPGESEIRALLVRTLNDRGEFQRALGIATAGHSPRPSAWLQVEGGRALVALERTAEAEQAFRSALHSYPDCGGARLELAELLLDGGRLEECAAELVLLDAGAPDEPAVILVRARLLETQGEAEAALAHLEAALERQVEGEHLRLAAARVLIDAGRPVDAWSVVEPLLDEPPGPDVLLQVARVAQLAERPIDALSILGAILLRDPTHPEALHDMLELVEDRHALVTHIAERRIRSAPEDPYGWGELLEEHLHAGRCQEVVDLLADAPAPVLAAPAVRLHEATALRRLGRTREARAKLEPLCREHDEPQDWYQLGMLEYAALRFEEAEAAFSRAGRDEYAADAHYVRALSLEQLGRSADAAAALEQAVSARPDFLEAWLRLGNECRLRLGDRNGARRAYRRYLDLGGDDAQIRRWMEDDR